MQNVMERREAPAEDGTGRDALSPRGGRGRETVVVLALAALAAAAWLPFVHAPLTSDEGGYLLVAHQWRPGSSLYGGYWVDRPPLLLWLFALARHLGPVHALTAVGVKVLGAAASGVSVVLVGVLGRLVAPGSPRRRLAATVLAVALLSSPLLGMPETDGEVLAVPFVLAGLCCVAAAHRAGRTRRALLLAAGAGAAATAAALVKQDMVDVAVLAVAVAVASRGRGLAGRAVAFCVGALATLGAALAAAAARGTSPAGLWDAVVAFRVQASAVIGGSASSATPVRLGLILAAFAASGAAALLVTYAVAALRRPSHLTWPALALVAWELVAVAMGGSYWLHYLTGLVPGLALLVLVVRPTPRLRKVAAVCLAYAVVASVAVWTHQAVAPLPVTTGDAAVVGYLRAHADRRDGVVVAYGHPDIVAGSGLRSPYEELWSLPVRVRDPHLATLTRVLESSRAPRWVVTTRTGLDSWGLDATTAQAYLHSRYTEQAAYGPWHVWERNLGAPVE